MRMGATVAVDPRERDLADVAARAGHGRGLRRGARDVRQPGGDPERDGQHGPRRLDRDPGHPHPGHHARRQRDRVQAAHDPGHLRPGDVRDLVQDDGDAPVRAWTSRRRSRTASRSASTRRRSPPPARATRARSSWTGPREPRRRQHHGTLHRGPTRSHSWTTSSPRMRERHLYRPLRVMSSAQGPIVSVDDRRVISLSSNDYLGLSHHPRMKRAAIEAVEQFGAGSGAVRTIAGHDDAPRGARGGAGGVQAHRGGPDVPVRVHRQHRRHPHDHRRDGPDRLGRAQPRLDHRRHAAVEGAAQGVPARRSPPRCARCSREAVRAGPRRSGRPVPADPRRDRRRVQHGRRHRAAARRSSRPPRRSAPPCMVDDAHASGVLGKDGRGSVSHFGLEGRVAIQVGTLSKAVGVLGGYVAGSQDLRDILVQRARPFLFSTSHPPAVAAACREAIRIMQDEPELIERLWANTRRFKAELGAPGLRHRPVRDPDHAGHAGRQRDDHPLLEPPVRGRRVRHVGRVPDRGPGPGADPDDRDRRPHGRHCSTRPLAAFDRVGPRAGRDRAGEPPASHAGLPGIDRADTRERAEIELEVLRAGVAAGLGDARDLPLDSHLHTVRSPDANALLDAYCALAVERGIAELAITDHVDFDPAMPAYGFASFADRERDVREAAERWATARAGDPVRRRGHLRAPGRGRHPRLAPAAPARLRDRQRPHQRRRRPTRRPTSRRSWPGGRCPRSWRRTSTR